MTLKSIFIFNTILLLMTACYNNPLDVDASKIQVGTKYINMDSVFVNADSVSFLEAHNSFLKEINEIYSYELGYCLGIRSIKDTTVFNGIKQFVSDPYIQRVENEIEKQFSDLSPTRKAITGALKRLKYHFPEGKIPNYVVFMNSLFSSNAFATEKEIGIGLERYLGYKTSVIQELPADQFFDWIKEGMDKRYLERDAICSWVMTHYVKDVDGNLAENMVRWGKILYLVNAAFPDEDPSLIMRYSVEDYKWATENEYALWKYLVDEKLLFKIDEKVNANMLREGPFTVGLPEKGPDRLGQFIGYRMILKYMEIKKISLKELIEMPYTEIIVEYEID